MRIGTREFQTEGHTYIMGILNVTPDSFSDGGKWNDMDAALRHVEEMIREGMDVLDIGGESTRPGYQEISCAEEIERTIPVIEKIKAEFDIPVSLDTYKGEVAQAGIDAGVDMINDIWGLWHDELIGDVIAKSGIPCCLMHNRKEAVYRNFISELTEDLEQIIVRAQHKGIEPEKIILDPGVGFGKSYENNLETIRCLGQLKKLGFPILLGCSRKSVIGLTLNLPVEERLEGTLVTTVQAVIADCMFVRVHDVKENRRTICMAEAILGKGVNG